MRVVILAVLASACGRIGFEPACSSCLSDVPAGWSFVGLAEDSASTCPNGFSAADVVTADIAACACTCQIDAADPPSCARGMLQGSAGNTTCDGAIAPVSFAGTGCTAYGSSVVTVAFAELDPIPLYRGTCIAGVATATAPATVSRLCVPAIAPTCLESICGEASQIASCVVHDGDVPCPSAEFPTHVLVGSAGETVCGGCTTCQSSASCGAATVRIYDDPQCATEVSSAIADGTCQAATGPPGQPVTHSRYDVAMLDTSCAPIDPPQVSATLTDTRTVCCR